MVTLTTKANYEKPTQIGIAIRTVRRRSNMMAVFRCGCGRTFLCLAASVKHGATKSCGCRKRIATAERNRTHGKSKSKIYHVWHNMMRRCHDVTNKRYKDWGGRGIVVDARWHTFVAFYADVGDVPFEGAQIDRIDNEKGYEVGNIRWVTNKENNSNTRRSRFVCVGGQKCCVAEAARRIGMSRYQLRHMLNRGDIPATIEIEVVE